jgi:hypothetical protein
MVCDDEKDAAKLLAVLRTEHNPLLDAFMGLREIG